jgi:hypothetical protein
LGEYELLRDMKINQRPLHQNEARFIETLAVVQNLYCIVPFVEKCNTLPSEGNEDIVSYLIPNKGFYKFALSRRFKTGDKYTFNYNSIFSNEYLLTTYGSYIKDNKNDSFLIKINLKKDEFPSIKNEICKKIKCLDSSIDEFYTSNDIRNLKVQIPIEKNTINNKIINFIRLILEPVQNFNSTKVMKSLKKNRSLSYFNEIGTFAYYRDLIIGNIDSNPIRYV